MNKNSGRNAVIMGALIVGAMRLWQQVRGEAKSPFSEWAIGYGALFFMLALLSEGAPGVAGGMSILVAVADFLKNGVGLTKDITGLISNTEKNPSGSVFVGNPFATSNLQPSTATSPSKSPRENTTIIGPGGLRLVGG